MSTFIADDVFDAPREQPKVEESVNADVATPSIVAGETYWFEEETPFNTLVTQLQHEEKLPSNPVALPLPYLSVSQVELYLKCPMQFYFRYVKGMRKAPGIAMVQGTTIHKAVEVGYRHVIKSQGEAPSLELILDTYSGTLDEGLKEEVVWDDDGDDDNLVSKDPGKVKDQGVGLLKKWHREKLPKVKPRSVEKSFVTHFGGVPVVGRIDLVDRIEKPMSEDGAAKLEMHPLLDAVVDNKVVGKTYTKAMVDSKLQMSLYAHATGLPNQRYDLFVKTKIPKLVDLSTSRNAQQVRWAVKIFTEVAKAISAGQFPPCSPDNFLCNEKWCGYYSICRGGV